MKNDYDEVFYKNVENCQNDKLQRTVGLWFIFKDE